MQLCGDGDSNLATTISVASGCTTGDSAGSPSRQGIVAPEALSDLLFRVEVCRPRREIKDRSRERRSQVHTRRSRSAMHATVCDGHRADSILDPVGDWSQEWRNGPAWLVINPRAGGDGSQPWELCVTGLLQLVPPDVAFRKAGWEDAVPLHRPSQFPSHSAWFTAGQPRPGADPELVASRPRTQVNGPVHGPGDDQQTWKACWASESG